MDIFTGATAGITNALAYPAFLRVFKAKKIQLLLLYSVLCNLTLAVLGFGINFYYAPFIARIGVWFGSEKKSLWGALLSSLWCRKITKEMVNPVTSSASSTAQPQEKKPKDLLAMVEMGLGIVVDIVPVVIVIIELAVIQMVPYLGPLLSAISRSLYYSYVMFTFKWNEVTQNSPGSSIGDRMTYLEKNWPFFVGYALPLVVLTTVLPANFVQNWAYAFLLPIWVILTHFARVPVPLRPKEEDVTTPSQPEQNFPHKEAPFQLPLFALPKVLHRRAAASYEAFKSE